MYKGKKILGIIPARSGSKGLKDKNIKPLGGKPLIGYTIKAALDSKMIDNVIVSTDSEQYRDIAKSLGAEVPFLRSSKLSEDETKTEDVIVDLISKLEEKYDYFILLQPTSPLRTSEDIKNVIKLIVEEDLESVVSVCEVDHSPYLMNVLNKDLSMEGFISNNKRRQDYEKFYRINGAIYLMQVDKYLECRNFYGKNSKAYIMSKERSIDIDSLTDFEFVDHLIGNYNKSKNIMIK